jgi:TolB protein
MIRPLLGLLASLLFCAVSGEELFIESTAEGQVKLNIAVLGFAQKNPEGNRKIPTDPAAVIKSDLKFSGRFNVFETDKPDTVFFRENSISVFVDGKYDFAGDKVLLECFLHDALSLNLITGKPYSVTPSNLRRAAHLFSDEIVYRLFGEKGIAGTQIVCTQKHGMAKEIVLLDYDGHNPVRITNNNRLNLTPCWSPDNKAVVYTSYRQETPALYITWIYTGKTDRLTANDRLNFSPSWNGVEDKIAFASSVKGDCQIFVMEKDGSGMKQLTFRNSLESSPCFSPNGYEIVFTSDRMGNPQVFIMDSEGANQRRLTYQGKYNDAPCWSPRGDRIAYMSLEEGGFNIYTVNVDGTDVKKLTDKSGNNEHPGYSPDGRLVVFASNRAGGSDLYLMNEDGSEQTRITFTGDLYSPSWSGY